MVTRIQTWKKQQQQQDTNTIKYHHAACAASCFFKNVTDAQFSASLFTVFLEAVFRCAHTLSANLHDKF